MYHVLKATPEGWKAVVTTKTRQCAVELARILRGGHKGKYRVVAV